MCPTATATETAQREFTIPSGKQYAAEEILSKINKRAEKLGAAPITYSFSEPRRFVITEASSGFVLVEPITIEVVTLTVSTEIVRLKGGWRLAAVVEAVAEDDGTTLNYLTGPLADRCVAYRTAKPKCMHCKVDRFRKLTYCLQNDAGEIVQVGSTCLEDFLGINPAAAVAGLEGFDEVVKTLSDEDEFGCGYGRGVRTLDLMGVVVIACAMIRLKGYKNAASCYGTNDSPTWQSVEYQLCAIRTSQNRDTFIAPSEADLVQAAQILARWKITAEQAKATIAAGQDPSDWDFKLYVLIKMNYIKTEAKFFAFVTGAVSGTIGAVAREAEQAARRAFGPSEFHAEVGKRVEILFDVDRMKTFDSDYGERVLIAGRVHNTGHQLVLWTGIECSNKFGFKAGEVTRLCAKIKEHKDDPKYGKQTILQRPTKPKKVLTTDEKKVVNRLKKLVKRMKARQAWVGDIQNRNATHLRTLPSYDPLLLDRWEEALRKICR